jgi:hypothetical protein
MRDFDLSNCREETIEEGARRFAQKICSAGAVGPAVGYLSSTESIMVALALCDRQFLPGLLRDAHAKELWFRLDDKQRAAVALWAHDCGNVWRQEVGR